MNQQHEDERSRIRAAMDRLLAGRPTAPTAASRSSRSPQRPVFTAWLCTSATPTSRRCSTRGCVREKHQTPEVERRLRKEVVRLKEARNDSRAAEAESRHRAGQMALAAAVLILRRPDSQDQPALGNVIPLRPSDD